MFRAIIELLTALFTIISPISVECSHGECTYLLRPEPDCPDLYTGYDFIHHPDCPYITNPTIEPDGTIDIGT